MKNSFAKVKHKSVAMLVQPVTATDDIQLSS